MDAELMEKLIKDARFISLVKELNQNDEEFNELKTFLINNYTRLFEKSKDLKDDEKTDEMKMSINKLADITGSTNITQLVNYLRSLTCNINSSLPNSIYSLINLRELDISYNQLTSLPDLIGNLKKLEVLYCDNNKLTNLPESIRHLSRLKDLNCGSNQFTDLPESICSLIGLQRLIVSGNQLTDFPESIRHLSGLEYLSCGSNQFTDLPESICSLIGLKYLIMNNNQLSSLPESIGSLSNLRILDCSYNKLTNYSGILKLQNKNPELKINCRHSIDVTNMIEDVQDFHFKNEVKNVIKETTKIPIKNKLLQKVFKIDTDKIIYRLNKFEEYLLLNSENYSQVTIYNKNIMNIKRDHYNNLSSSYTTSIYFNNKSIRINVDDGEYIFYIYTIPKTDLSIGEHTHLLHELKNEFDDVYLYNDDESYNYVPFIKI